MSAARLSRLSLSDSTDSDDSTTASIMTPSSTSSENDDWSFNSLSTAIPEAGNSYIICSESCERALTLLNGDLVLDSLDGHGSNIWKCFTDHGWFVFRNAASGASLSHALTGVCSCPRNAPQCRQVHIHQRQRGGYTLLMEDKGSLEPLGVSSVPKKMPKLRRLEHADVDDAIAWVFLNVGQTSVSFKNWAVKSSVKILQS